MPSSNAGSVSVRVKANRLGWLAAIAIAASILPSNAFAWGSAGHKIVCEIAFQELAASTRTQVKDWIRSDPDYSSFAESCTWPDDIRDIERYDRYRSLHYVNAERGAAALPKDCPRGCVLSAIREEATVLRDSAQSPARRLEALKFLGHFVGDLHQPLHAGYRDDRGGNKVTVTFYGESQRLHKVWDTLLIAQRTNDWRALARELSAAITPVDRTIWASPAPHIWANESLQLVARRVYDFEAGEDLARSYYRRNIASLEERLMAAGVRLARLLDRVLSSDEGDLFR